MVVTLASSYTLLISDNNYKPSLFIPSLCRSIFGNHSQSHQKEMELQLHNSKLNPNATEFYPSMFPHHNFHPSQNMNYPHYPSPNITTIDHHHHDNHLNVKYPQYPSPNITTIDHHHHHHQYTNYPQYVSHNITTIDHHHQHQHQHQHHCVNYPKYPSPYNNTIDHQYHHHSITNKSTYSYHNYQTNLTSSTRNIPPSPAQMWSPGPSSKPIWPKKPGFFCDHGRKVDCSTLGNKVKKEGQINGDEAGVCVSLRSKESDIVGNNEKKDGLIICVKNGDQSRVIQGKGKFGKWSSKSKMILEVKPNGLETTAMIRNIPSQYTRSMLLKFLDDFCDKQNQELKEEQPPFAFDFVYLPVDFKSGANKGYAFVNFTHPNAVWKFHLVSSHKGWEYCKSPKICQIAYASMQGKEKLIEHFGKSRFFCHQQEYLPVYFSPPRDGSSSPVNPTTVAVRGMNPPVSSPKK